MCIVPLQGGQRWVQQLGHQALQSSCLEATHLARPVLNKTVGGHCLVGVCRWLNGLPAQGDPIDGAVLKLLTPLLNRVLQDTWGGV